MKSDGQVAQKLKQVKYRHFKKEAEALLKRRPSNCENCKVLFARGQSLGVCALDSEVCDFSEGDRSKDCGEFRLRHTKQEVKKSLRDFFETRATHEIAVRFPDIAALIWVLEGAQDGDLLPGSSLVGEIAGVELWAGSSVNASKAWEELQVLQAGGRFKEANSKLRSENESLRVELAKVETQLSQSSKALELLDVDGEVEERSLWKKLMGFFG